MYAVYEESPLILMIENMFRPFLNDGDWCVFQAKVYRFNGDGWQLN